MRVVCVSYTCGANKSKRRPCFATLRTITCRYVLGAQSLYAGFFSEATLKIFFFYVCVCVCTKETLKSVPLLYVNHDNITRTDVLTVNMVYYAYNKQNLVLRTYVYRPCLFDKVAVSLNTQSPNNTVIA